MTGRVFVFAALLLTSGCFSRLDSEDGRHYSCASDDQCREEWKCGKAGFCFDPLVPARLDCDDDSQCPNEHFCGLDNKCFAKDTREALRCVDNADCGGGWQCGLEGTCFDPLLGGTRRCETDAHCGGGWKCGLDKLCYDRAAGGPVQCRPDAGADPVATECAPQWRCGLEGVCHLRDAGTNYLCDSDDDCEEGWRCASEGRCADTRLQALVEKSVTFGFERVSPGMPAGITTIAVGLDGFANIAAYPADGGVELVRVDIAPFQSNAGTRFGGRRVVPLAENVSSLAWTTTGVWAVTGSGVFKMVAPDAGSFTAVAGSSQLSNGRVFAMSIPPSSGARAEEVLVSAGNALGYQQRNLGFVPGSGPDDGGIVAAATFPSSCSASPTLPSLIAATPNGLYHAPRCGDFLFPNGAGNAGVPMFRPLALPGAQSDACGRPGIDVDRLYFTGATGTVGARYVLGASSRTNQLIVWVAGGDSVDGGRDNGNCGALHFTTQYGACPACGPGEQLRDVLASGNLTQTWCAASVDGGTTLKTYEHNLSGGSCNLTLKPNAFGPRGDYVPSQSGAGVPDGIDGYGMPWICRSPGNCSPALIMSQVALTGADDALLGTAAFGGDPFVYDIVPGVGLVSTIYQYQQATIGESVPEEPTWVPGTPANDTAGQDPRMGLWVWPPWASYLRSTGAPLGSAMGMERFAAFEQSIDLGPPIPYNGARQRGVYLDPQWHSAALTLPSGDRFLVAAARDRIWGGGIVGPPTSGYTVMPLRLVPSPFGTITSLTAHLGVKDSAGVTPIVEGYVIAQNRLFRFRAVTFDQWLPDEIRVPAGVPLSVWSDGTRARVGTLDGRVYSLPIAVEVAPRVPTTEQILDYTQICGVTLVMTQKSIYRLDAVPGSALGAWTRVPMGNAYAPLSVGPEIMYLPPFHPARVGNQHSVYIQAEGGNISRVSATCP